MKLNEIKELVNEGNILRSKNKDGFEESIEGSYLYIGKYRESYFVFDSINGLDMGNDKMMNDFEDWLESYEYDIIDGNNDKEIRDFNKEVSKWVLDYGLES